jgi:predicted  nucleic acid-binding Zn-ribbon protein
MKTFMLLKKGGSRMTKLTKSLWEIKKQIKEIKFELELLKTDPSASHDEIVELGMELSRLRQEYSQRVKSLKLKVMGR